jgi:hypothetical protein
VRPGRSIDPGLLYLVAHGEECVVADCVTKLGEQHLLFLLEVGFRVLCSPDSKPDVLPKDL